MLNCGETAPAVDDDADDSSGGMLSKIRRLGLSIYKMFNRGHGDIDDLEVRGFSTEFITYLLCDCQ